MADALALLLAGAFGSDLLLVYLIGICPAIAVSGKLQTAAGLAVSNAVVAPLAALLSYTLIILLPDSAMARMVELPLMVLSIIVCLYCVASVAPMQPASRPVPDVSIAEPLISEETKSRHQRGD